MVFEQSFVVHLLSFKMQFFIAVTSALFALCACPTGALHASEAFKRVGRQNAPIIERANGFEPRFSNERLEKRASRWLTNKNTDYESIDAN